MSTQHIQSRGKFIDGVHGNGRGVVSQSQRDNYVRYDSRGQSRSYAISKELIFEIYPRTN